MNDTMFSQVVWIMHHVFSPSGSGLADSVGLWSSQGLVYYIFAYSSSSLLEHLYMNYDVKNV